MKRQTIRISALLMTIFILTASLSIPALGAENKILVQSDYQLLDDGFYIISSLDSTEYANTRSTTVTYSKTAKIFNKDNQIQCSLKVIGTFEYGGGTVWCKSYRTEPTVYNSSWTVEDIQARSGNSSSIKAFVTASCKFKKKVLGITIKTYESSQTLYCDQNGVAS